MGQEVGEVLEQKVFGGDTVLLCSVDGRRLYIARYGNYKSWKLFASIDSV